MDTTATDLRKSWGWFLALGILMIMGGTCAFFAPFMVSLVIEVIVGVFFAFGGIVMLVQVFTTKDGWNARLTYLILGLFNTLAGLMLLFRPLEGLMALTLVMIVAFLVNGLLRIAVGVMARPEPGSGWVIAGGVISVLVSIYLISVYPEVSVMLLGVMAAVSLISEGRDMFGSLTRSRRARQLLTERRHGHSTAFGLRYCAATFVSGANMIDFLSKKSAFAGAIALGFAASIGPVAAAGEKPRLVLQITVDQLRGDLIDRYGSHFGDGGFRFLQENGVSFANAHHRHANTETIVGHTTLSTGTDPAIHGMVANLWFDRKTGTPFYNVQDPDYPLVGAAGIDTANEIDPTQRAATTDGRSPRNIISSTLSDEIAMHFGPASKVFGVSVKDRAAIAMAGHAGQAYWFSKAEGRFVTSTFYRDDYPGWVANWEAKGKVASYANQDWTLMRDRNDYAFGDHDDQPWETALPGFGRTFPHNWGPADSKYFTTFLTLSPAGDEITVDFAKTLMDAEDVGADDVTDYLSVSLSSTDYVGHIFGPSSLEAEDNLARLDQSIADLLAHVDATVGLDNTLVVLSADHGAPEHPDYLATFGIEAGLFDFQRVDTEPGFVRLQLDFGASRDLIQNFSNPYLYLNQELIAQKGLDPEAVELAVADELRKLPGIAFAVGSSALRAGSFPRSKITDAVLANFHSERSGDIYVVFEPHWFVADFDGLTVASAHGSPWTYDTHVPLIFSGPGIKQKTVVRRVETVDVAPTVAVYLGTKLPSGTTGRALPEAMRQ